MATDAEFEAVGRTLGMDRLLAALLQDALERRSPEQQEAFMKPLLNLSSYETILEADRRGEGGILPAIEYAQIYIQKRIAAARAAILRK